MENKAAKLSISELFHPLGQKLYDLENEIKRVALDIDGHDSYPRIQEIMDTISRRVDAYEDGEVVVKCNSYLQRINKLKSNLKVGGYYDLTWYDLDNDEFFGKRVERTEQEINDALRIANEGLDYCTKHLIKIIENHKTFSNMETPKAVVTEIRLPDNFTVKQLNVHFDPLLSLRQATLFLYYLREKGVIPNYNSSELGRLGEYFFARNNKNIREELTDIHENRENEEDLKALQQMLKSILKEVTSDLEKAR